jgi:hypothetical protein
MFDLICRYVIARNNLLRLNYSSLERATPKLIPFSLEEATLKNIPLSLEEATLKNIPLSLEEVTLKNIPLWRGARGEDRGLKPPKWNSSPYPLQRGITGLLNYSNGNNKLIIQ